tara:strand:+ start:640 stop:1059 length:420 start_codon:yes stop_codon:yes gene_type:complete
LKKKISQKDIKDWSNFIHGNEKLYNKDRHNLPKKELKNQYTIDLHGYSLEKANNKISKLIEECFNNKIAEINVITGKGTRSKVEENPFVSKDLSILKHSIPDYIKSNSELMSKIKEINFEDISSPSKGNFKIFLKKIKE